MLIRVSAPAAVFDFEGEPATSAEVRRRLDGVVYDDEAFTDYLGGPPDETAVALLLEHGGCLSFRFDESLNRLVGTTEYRAARRLDDQELKVLVEYTLGQWSDGIGENLVGESFGRFGYTIQCGTENVSVSQIDDGVPCHGNPAADLFRAIDSADVAGVIRTIPRCQDINARLAGCTPLTWAIVYNHPEMAIALARYSDVDATDQTGFTPLMSLACSRMSDADAVRVAKALIDAGANIRATDGAGHTAAALAEIRGKTQLHALLLTGGGEANHS
jgi:hypothetical protein